MRHHISFVFASFACFVFGCAPSMGPPAGGVGGGGDGGAHAGGGGVGGGDPAIATQSFGHASAATCAAALGAGEGESTVLLAVDGAGNAFVASDYSPTFRTFGIVVSKVDAACHVVWARQFTDKKPVDVTAIAADPTGGTVLAGTFVGTIDLGSGPLQSATEWRTAEFGDLFLTKLDDAGNTVWVQHIETDAAPTALGVAASGEVFVAGRFSGGETLHLGPTALQPSGDPYECGFVAAFLPSGTPAWGVGFGLDDGNGAVPTALALDPSNGDVVIGGYGIGLAPSVGAFALAKPDLFVARLASDSGQVASVTPFTASGKLAKEPRGAGIGSLDVDAAGDILVAGKFDGSIAIGDLQLDDPETAIAPQAKHGSYAQPTFVAELDPAGNAMWLRFTGEASVVCVPTTARFAASGDAVVTGCLVGTLDLGGGTLSVPTSFEDEYFGGLLLAELGPHGEHVSSRVFGPSVAFGRGVAPAPGGGVVLAGAFDGPLHVDSHVLQEHGYREAFIARFAP